MWSKYRSSAIWRALNVVIDDHDPGSTDLPPQISWGICREVIKRLRQPLLTT